MPILGFCFGHQEIAKHYGGTVDHTASGSGAAPSCTCTEPHALFKGLSPIETVWMSHCDSVTAVGDGFRELGWSKLGANAEPHRNAAIADDVRRRYGFQFHPEVDDTVHGDAMLANFVLEICGCRPTWTMDRYVDEQVERDSRAGRRPFACSCWRPAASTRRWPPGCSWRRWDPIACNCCTSTTG